MGHTYSLLQPIWDEHPDLGRAPNPDLMTQKDQPPLPETSPQGLIPYLEKVEGALPDVVSRVLADASFSAHKSFIKSSAQDIEGAIAHAKQLFGQNANQDDLTKEHHLKAQRRKIS